MQPLPTRGEEDRHRTPYHTQKPEPPNPSTLRERTLSYLTRREHSRFELARKLEKTGYLHKDINTILDEFERKNWLSDRRFTESYVADHRSKYGAIKLAYELRLRGIEDATIEAVLNNNRDGELERAREVWRKKFGTPPATPAEKAKQIRFLQSRGFPLDTIWSTIDILIRNAEN